MLNISNIQHFSLGDGEGLRTTVFLKGCNLRCPWCHNPENIEREPCVLNYKTTGQSEICGRYASNDEIFDELLEDEAFFTESGGGVTFSGGEPMLQAKELCVLAKRLYGRGISVLIDTAGSVPYSSFELLSPFVSGYLFDFKTADESRYKMIGGNIELVSENIRKLVCGGERVYIRIPLISDFNCDAKQTEAICRHLNMLGIKSVELIPFHRLGSAKYEAMGLCWEYKNKTPLSSDEMSNIENVYKKYFNVKRER